ncbi:MAG TPA: mersacidin/lichenicidin family type 2 lantibiotic [Blastocatellia bacterium]|nr:mersacidin/lichenicidin family type 2 lantibiotic [Blastocatellia bacterium]
MTLTDKIRAWKEPAFRAGLSEAELMQMPAHPAGMMELSGTALDAVAGGGGKSKSKSKGKSSRSGKSRGSGKSGRSGKSHGRKRKC